MLVTWLTISMATAVNAVLAAIAAFIVMVVGGMTIGFWQMRGEFRLHLKLRSWELRLPSASWGVGWLVSSLRTLRARYVGSVGGVKVGSLAPWEDQVSLNPNIAILVHGTWSGHRYDWSQWKNIASELERQGWRVMRFAWAGGNSGLAREVAAEQLIGEVAKLREGELRGQTLLVGHSHGGTVALDAAGLGEVNGVVTLGTPFIELGRPVHRSEKFDRRIGQSARLFGPILLGPILLFAASRPTSGDITSTLLIVLGLLLTAGMYVIAVLRMATAANDEAAAVAAGRTRRPIGSPVLLAVTAPTDEVMQVLRSLDTASSEASQFIRRRFRRERLGAMRYLLPTRSTASPFGIPFGPWLREVVALAVFGAGLLLLLICLDQLGVYSDKVSILLRPWLYPTRDEMGAKYFVYAAALLGANSTASELLHKTWLPAPFEVSLQVGRYLAGSTRLSQLLSFKSGLFGYSAFCLHGFRPSIRTADCLAGMTQVPISSSEFDSHRALVQASDWISKLAQALRPTKSE